MGDFKEWLSDNLRYFLVGVVVILIIGGSILGLKIYSSAVNGKDEPALIQKNTQAQTENKKETETKKETEKETKKQTEKETKKQTEKATEKTTEKTDESQASASAPDSAGNSSDGSSSYDDGSAQNGQNDDTYSDSSNYDYSYDDSQQAEVITPETEAPQPQYMTINAACYMRSYPDYGDNIIGQFDAGTTVQFLSDEGGWYKVSVNGQTGYIGARFFN